MPNGNYNPQTGEICVFVDTAGTYPITVIANSECATDTCHFNLVV